MNLFRREKIIEENTIKVQHVEELVINSDIANILFVTHLKKQVDVLLETYKKGPELQVNVVNKMLEINATVQDKKKVFITPPDFCKLTIKLPSDLATRYMVHSTAGNIKAANLTFNTANLKTNAGNIWLENLDANELTLESGAGNIRMRHIDSETLIAQTGAGNIEGNDCTGDITAKTGAGNIRVNLDGDEHVKLNSGTGSIHAFFKQPDSLNATIKASAGIGSIQTDLPFLFDGEKSSKLSSVVGQGEKILQFNTGVGSIHLLAEN